MSTPTSPNEMPNEFRNDAAGMMNLIRSLDQNECVSIHWEIDIRASNSAGEKVGWWEITIENGRDRVNVKHREITNALWFAAYVADSASGAAYRAQEAARNAALAKLTKEEKRILGI